MKIIVACMLLCLFILGCSESIKYYGKHYQQHHDFKSLKEAVALIPLNADTAYVKSILGEPISMGFDYRYLVDSVSPNGCAVGAVFHINSKGEIDNKWIDEICE